MPRSRRQRTVKGCSWILTAVQPNEFTGSKKRKKKHADLVLL